MIPPDVTQALVVVNTAASLVAVVMVAVMAALCAKHSKEQKNYTELARSYAMLAASIVNNKVRNNQKEISSV